MKQPKVKLQDFKDGYEKVKSGVKKGVEKVRKGVHKVQKFSKTPEGKLLARTLGAAGLHYLKESGLGKKMVEKINDKASKYTKVYEPLDISREIVHASFHNYLERQPLPSPSYNYDKPTINLTRTNYQRPTVASVARYYNRRR